MSSWLRTVGTRLEQNMAPCLEKVIYSHPLVNVDETPVRVLGLLGEDGKRRAPHSSANAFMMVRAAVDGHGRNGPVMFTFTENRKNATIESFLRPYTGVVQTDGLYGYANAEKACSFTHIGCLVHARRKAVEANGDRKSGIAFELLKLYASFFHEEGKLRDSFDAGEITEEVFLSRRRGVLEPILDRIHGFCLGNVDKAIGKLKSALQYPLDRWETLVGFLDYPFATSSNQRAENAIRPFTVGRKNWLFNITESGAQVSAFFYSLVETCKAMGIIVNDYLTYLFMNANTIKDGDEEAWLTMLPGRCDISGIKSYREMLLAATPDSDRTEPYRLRGKRV
jgi:transposase